jgi:hypothetical protein
VLYRYDEKEMSDDIVIRHLPHHSQKEQNLYLSGDGRLFRAVKCML